jgi:hypothetical protein
MRTRQLLLTSLFFSLTLCSCSGPDIETVEHWQPWLKEDGRTLAVTKILDFVHKYDDLASKSWRTSEKLVKCSKLVADYKAKKVTDEVFFKLKKEAGLNRDLFEALGMRSNSEEMKAITELDSLKATAETAAKWVAAFDTHAAGKSEGYIERAKAAELKATKLANEAIDPLVAAYTAKNSQKVFLRSFLELIGFHENRAAHARSRNDEAAAKAYDDGAIATARKLSPAFGQALKDYTEPDGARLAAATVIRFKLTADHVKVAEQIINDTSAPHTNVMSALDILVESPPDITAVPALVRILDQDPDKRPVVLAGLAAKILGGLKAKEAVQGLVNCLWRTDAYGRNSAPECRVALTQLGPKNTFDMLVKTLQRKNESVEQRATQYGFKDKGAVEAKVADLLGQLGNPRATDILLGYLTLSETPPGCERFLGEEEEKEALSKGKKSKKERCIAEQVEFLEDSYFSKKKEECIQLQADYVLGQTERFLQVTKALAKLQADKALPKLIEFAQAETSALQVKQAVVEQLAVMGKPKAVPMLMKLLKDKDAYILPEGTEVDKLGEESPNARSGSDRNGGRPGLIRAIHDYRQKILTTAVRIASPNDEKANKAIAKEIADTRSRFAAFKKQNKKEVDDFESGRADWDAYGAAAYIEKFKASIAWRTYTSTQSRYTSYLVAGLAAKSAGADTLAEWTKKSDELKENLKSEYTAALEAKLIVKKNDVRVADKAAKTASDKEIKAAKAAYAKARKAQENYEGELNEVKKDANRVLNVASKEADARFKRIPKDAHQWAAATNKALDDKAKSCAKATESSASTASVTVESCMAKDDKAPKKKATPESAECKYVQIIQVGRPDEPSKKSKKKTIEVPKIEKVKKDYDLKIAFRLRNVEYFEKRLKRYDQLSGHLKTVRKNLPKSEMSKLAQATVKTELTDVQTAAEAKLPKEERKKVEAERQFNESLGIDDRLFVAYRLLNGSTKATSTSDILKRLEEENESVFQIYLQGASRHTNTKNVAALKTLEEKFVNQATKGDDDRKRKMMKIRAQQVLPIIELAKQRR